RRGGGRSGGRRTRCTRGPRGAAPAPAPGSRPTGSASPCCPPRTIASRNRTLPDVTNDLRTNLFETAARIADYRDRVATARVGPAASLSALVAGFDRPLGGPGLPVSHVLDELAAAAEPGLVGSAGPRYYGFVTGGSLDAALCADLMVCGWDQLAFNAVSSPAAFAVEVVAGRWVKELLSLPSDASVGFVTGGQAANTVALAAARTSVLADAGW